MFWFGLPAATYNGEAFTLKLTDASGNSLLDGSENVQFDCYSKTNWEKPLLFLLQNDGGTIRFLSPFAQEVSDTIYLHGVLTINRLGLDNGMTQIKRETLSLLLFLQV